MFHVGDPDWIEGGAACLDRWDLFAPAERHPDVEGIRMRRARVAEAVAICEQCPMLDACRAWTFKNRPTGTVSGGIDLTQAEETGTMDDGLDDFTLYRDRIEALAEEVGIVLTDYQRHWMGEHLRGRNPSWISSGKRVGHRAQCMWLLEHPRVAFLGPARGA